MNPHELAAKAEGEEHTLMATTSKQPGRSFSDARQLIELAKTMDLEAVVKRTGRKPEAVLKMAKRLGVSLKSANHTKAKRQ
jgi:hypothetical protein